MAQQDNTASRGKGLFFNLYGSTATASAMTAWVWGVSRTIDALENTPSANINTQKIGVTGCSRDGKGALMAGAFEPRIALTIPQESGSGGDACWRLSKFEKDSGQVVQEATEIVTENVWFSSNFNNYVNSINTLPYDHHLLAAMIAPRAMISYENTDFEWLSPLSSFGCMSAAHTVWQALGVPQNHGFEQIGGHQHCQWPANLTASLNAFFDKFLLDKTDTTDFFATNDVFAGVPWSPSQWIQWTTPTLSGNGTAAPPPPASSVASTTVATTSVASTASSTPTTGPVSGSAAHWAQCGGIGWTGATAWYAGFLELKQSICANICLLQCFSVRMHRAQRLLLTMSLKERRLNFVTRRKTPYLATLLYILKS